jgi:hypothetical protein
MPFAQMPFAQFAVAAAALAPPSSCHYCSLLPFRVAAVPSLPTDATTSFAPEPPSTVAAVVIAGTSTSRSARISLYRELRVYSVPAANPDESNCRSGILP